MQKTLTPAFPNRSQDEAPIVLALCTDKNFVQPTAAAISSILQNRRTRRPFDILVLETGLAERDKLNLLSCADEHKDVSVRFYDMGDQYKTENFLGSRVPANYFVLRLPSILSHYDRVLYLDGDTITTTDIGELFDTDLSDNLIAACHDPCLELALRDRSYEHLFLVAGSPFNNLSDYYLNYVGLRQENIHRYFNSGVVLFSLEKLRAGNYEQRFADLLRARNGLFLHVDQDIFNHFFQDKCVLLDPRWNAMTHTRLFSTGFSPSVADEYAKALKQPFIVHYTGEDKPWQNTKAPHSDIYWKALQNTLWYDLKKTSSVNLQPDSPKKDRNAGNQKNNQTKFQGTAKIGNKENIMRRVLVKLGLLTK